MASVESALMVLNSNNDGIDEKLCLRNFLIKRINQLNSLPKKNVSLDDLLLTHQIFLTSTYKPFVSSSSIYQRHSVQGNLAFGTKLQIPLLWEGDFIHDMSVQINIDGIGKLHGNPSYTDTKYKYCNYPGIRLIKCVTLYVNGKKIDSYGPHEMLFYMNYELPADKRDAFKKCVGEDTGTTANYYNVDFEINQQFMVQNGYQTFKSYQPPLSLSIPLLFWFNKELSKSLPVLKQTNKNTQIVNQNYLEITLGDLTDIVQSAVYVDDPTKYPTPFMNVLPTLPPTVKPTLQVEVYSNNIFVNNEVRSFYLRNVNRYLITLYNNQVKTISGRDSSVLLNELKEMGMTESIYFAFQPYSNIKSFDKWYSYSIIPNENLYSWYPIPVFINQPAPTDLSTNIQSTNTNNVFFFDIRRATYFKLNPTINNFTLSFDTIPFISKMDVNYYSTYLPALLSSQKLTAPSDPGIYFVPFNREVFTTTSGHVNLSKFTQLKLDWSFSKFNNVSDSYQLYISGKVLDFLVVNENSIELLSNIF
jgi:hypothetical protein